MSQTINTSVKISGMTCPACEKLIGKRLSKIDGVAKIKVNLKNNDAQVEGTRKLTINEVQKVFTGTQYQVIDIY